MNEFERHLFVFLNLNDIAMGLAVYWRIILNAVYDTT